MVDFSAHPECDVRMHGSVVVGPKGQIVIPKDVRDLLNISPGDNLIVITKHGKAVGMVKTDDLEELMEYVRREMDAVKALALKDLSENRP